MIIKEKLPCKVNIKVMDSELSSNYIRITISTSDKTPGGFAAINNQEDYSAHTLDLYIDKSNIPALIKILKKFKQRKKEG